MSTPPFTPEEVDHCLKVLGALVEDRACLDRIPLEKCRELLVAAGRVSRPEREAVTRLYKERRRAKRARKQREDRELRATTVIRAARRTEVFLPPARREIPAAEPERELNKPRSCYVCKAEYRSLHFFYDAMCKSCGDFNYAKRFQTARLDGRVAVITGARVKIGYQAALMCLKAGARVIVTTRFPHDAALRYAREADFPEWKDRLQIHGLDLRHAPSVECFSRYLDETCDRLDILINNAAQTVRRPPGFYAHMMAVENQAVENFSPDVRRLIAGHEACTARLALAGARSPTDAGADDSHAWLARLSTEGGAIGLRIPAALSQVPVLAGDTSNSAFPDGARDADLQQIDLRPTNSWRMRLADVPTPELLEVQLVNSIAPFILCRELKPLMLRDTTGEKHIVNVSAMEGKFTRFTKTDRHPHTNMAKAALNMMTLTSAPDYAESGIFMNAVDTGWVTDEDPFQDARRKREELDFQPPLDIVDGAARVCDPFFSGLLTGEHTWGKFLKDYLPTAW